TDASTGSASVTQSEVPKGHSDRSRIVSKASLEIIALGMNDPVGLPVQVGILKAQRLFDTGKAVLCTDKEIGPSIEAAEVPSLGEERPAFAGREGGSRLADAAGTDRPEVANETPVVLRGHAVLGNRDRGLERFKFLKQVEQSSGNPVCDRGSVEATEG